MGWGSGDDQSARNSAAPYSIFFLISRTVQNKNVLMWSVHSSLSMGAQCCFSGGPPHPQ